MSITREACGAVNNTEKLGPTGVLAGVRSTPVNTQEEARMSTSIIARVADAARSATVQAVEQFQAGTVTAEQLVEAIDDAHRQVDAAIAAVPVPPCPQWCTLPGGHPFQSHETHDETGLVDVTRWHKRTFLDTPQFEVLVEAEERRTHTFTAVGEPRVSTIGELSQVDAQAACKVARALLAATELLITIAGGDR